MRGTRPHCIWGGGGEGVVGRVWGEEGGDKGQPTPFEVRMFRYAG